MAGFAKMLSGCFVVAGLVLCVDGSDPATAGGLPKNSVGSRQIRNGQVKPQDLANSAKPAMGAASSYPGTSGVSLTPYATVRTVTINAPGPGAVIAIYNVLAAAEDTYSVVACAPTTGTSILDEAFAQASMPEIHQTVTVSGSLAFPVASKGNVTVELRCVQVSGVVTVYKPSLTLLFVPSVGTVVNQ